MELPLLLAGLCSLDGVLPMIPSEAAVLAAGVFAHTGTTSLVLIVVATALGVFVGDHLAYGLSHSVFGPRLISRSARIRRAVTRAAGHLDRRTGLLIVASRFLPGGRITMNLACGTAGVPLRRFSPASAIGAVAWAAYTVGLGYAGGAAFAENPLLGVGVGLGLSFVFGAAAELVRRRLSTTATPRPTRGTRRRAASSRRRRPGTRRAAGPPAPA
jgi:membrane protein DedA with SNARE-associated domain